MSFFLLLLCVVAGEGFCLFGDAKVRTYCGMGRAGVPLLALFLKEALFLEEETVSGISFDDGMGAVVARDGCGSKNVKCQNAE